MLFFINCFLSVYENEMIFILLAFKLSYRLKYMEKLLCFWFHIFIQGNWFTILRFWIESNEDFTASDQWLLALSLASEIYGKWSDAQWRCSVQCLTHLGWVTHICVGKISSLGHIMACLLVGAKPLSNQCRNSVNWNLMNKLQINFGWNSIIFMTKNWLDNVICEMASILSQPQSVNSLLSDHSWHHIYLLEMECQ